MALPQFITGISIGGNTPQEKIVLDAITVQVKGILSNETAAFSFRANRTANQIAQLSGIGTAIYRLAKRLVWSKDYDLVAGATAQTQGAYTLSVELKEQLNLKWDLELYDMERLSSGNVATIAALIAEWASNMASNLVYNLDLIFLQGIIDYCIASYDYQTTPTRTDQPVIALDLEKVSTTEAEAQQNFYAIGDRIVTTLGLVTSTQVGVSKQDMSMVVSLRGFLQFTKAFTKFIDNTGANTLAGGRLFSQSILGVSVEESIWVNRTFDKATDSKMNIEVSYDTSGTTGLVVHKEAFAMPMSFEAIRQVINPATGNIRYIGKCMYALPTSVRGNLAFIIRKTLPTKAEGQIAQGKNGKTYRRAEFDPAPVIPTSR